MPTSTFYNLPEAKRQMIEAVLLNVFYDQHISEVSVSQIVEEAQISRAAFYKYFPTLEDAHRYMIKKIAGLIHQDILKFIYQKKECFFEGITDYLAYCSRLSLDSPEWKGLNMLIKGENTVLYRREPLNNDSPMLTEWFKLLQLNQFKIAEPQEALAFLYFAMDLVMDSLSSFIANQWGTKELLEDFAFKQKWLEKGMH